MATAPDKSRPKPENIFLEADHFYRTRGHTLGKEYGAPSLVQLGIVQTLQKRGDTGKRELAARVCGKRNKSRLINLPRAIKDVNLKFYLYYTYHSFPPAGQFWLKANGTVKIAQGEYTEHFGEENSVAMEAKKEKIFRMWGIEILKAKKRAAVPKVSVKEAAQDGERKRAEMSSSHAEESSPVEMGKTPENFEGARVLLKKRYLESGRSEQLLTEEEVGFLVGHRKQLRLSWFEEKFLVWNFVGGKRGLLEWVKEIPKERLRKYLSEMETAGDEEQRKQTRKTAKALLGSSK